MQADRCRGHIQELYPFGIVAAIIAALWGLHPTPRSDIGRAVAPPAPRAATLVFDRARSRLELFRGDELLGVFGCAFDLRHPHRLPPGRYAIHHQRTSEAQHREYLLAYPSAELARYARQQGWIDGPTLERVEEAHRYGLLPPQDTRLGPAIRIAGGGRDRPQPGAIHLDDEDLEQLAPFLAAGVVVQIR